MLMPSKIMRELYEVYWENNSNIADLNLSSEQVAQIISATKINLAGWTKPVEANWLAVDTVPDVHYLSHIAMLYPGQVRLEVQRSERCYISTTGGVYCEEWDEKGRKVCETGKTYQFTQSGGLVCVRYILDTMDHEGRPAHRRHDVAGSVRTKDAGGPVTDEEALGVMAALLGEFNQFRYALSRPAVNKQGRMVAAGKLYQVAAAKHLAHGPDPAVEMISELCGVVIRHHEAQMDFITHLPQRPTEARARFMGPLQVAFELLYGKAATNGFVPVADDSEREEADSPFIRFAEAFFIMVGLPCKRNTINSALRDWRAARNGQ